MFILGIETATSVVSVALTNKDNLLAERSLNYPQAHAMNLLLMIKDVLEHAGVNSGQLQGIAVSLGPGSFTGLRIGVAAAKTLAQVWKLPVLGVGTLEALAYPWTGLPSLICPVIGARKNEVYAAVYCNAGKAGECLLEPEVWAPSALAKKLKTLLSPVYFTGDVSYNYKELFQEYLGGKAVFAPRELSLPRSVAVAGLGWRKLQNKKISDPLLLAPLYLSVSEAEAKWLQKQKTAEKI